jgi:hypothetical protein
MCYNFLKREDSMKRLVASTQYGDWKGSVRADDSGFRESLGQLLVEKKLVNEGEHLIAASLWVGENHGKKLGMAYLFTGLEGYPNIQVALETISGAIPVRIVKLNMSLSDFFLLFKRFSILLTRGAIDLNGREIVEAH